MKKQQQSIPTNNFEDEGPNAFVSTSSQVDPDVQAQKDTARRRLFWVLVFVCLVIAGLLAWEITDQILALKK